MGQTRGLAGRQVLHPTAVQDSESQQVAEEKVKFIKITHLTQCRSERSDTCAARQCSENPYDYLRDPSLSLGESRLSA